MTDDVTSAAERILNPSAVSDGYAEMWAQAKQNAADARTVARAYLALADAPPLDAAVREIVRECVVAGAKIHMNNGPKPGRPVSLSRVADETDAAVATFLARLRPHLRPGLSDDDEPVTEEWLQSAGFRDVGRGCLCVNPTDGTALLATSRGWCLSEAVAGEWCGEVTVKTPANRGAVRRLCAAIGVTLRPEPR